MLKLLNPIYYSETAGSLLWRIKKAVWQKKVSSKDDMCLPTGSTPAPLFRRLKQLGERPNYCNTEYAPTTSRAFRSSPQTEQL